jgi:hypothetical protein
MHQLAAKAAELTQAATTAASPAAGTATRAMSRSLTTGRLALCEPLSSFALARGSCSLTLPRTRRDLPCVRSGFCTSARRNERHSVLLSADEWRD